MMPQDSTLQDADEMVLCAHPRIIRLRNLKEWLQQNDAEAKGQIIGFIHHRLQRRYLTPLQHVPPDFRSGFLMMASACLLVETLQSFYDGKNETERGMSKPKFWEFFEREIQFFPRLAEQAKEFYVCIRCGILHQAETTGGWRVLRSGPLFDAGRKTINATAFLGALERCLENYIRQLHAAGINSPLWLRAADKVRFICQNCHG